MILRCLRYQLNKLNVFYSRGMISKGLRGTPVDVSQHANAPFIFILQHALDTTPWSMIN